VVKGERDPLVGSAQGLADRIPGAQLRIIPGNHITAVNDPAFRGTIVEFLRQQPAA